MSELMMVQAHPDVSFRFEEDGYVAIVNGDKAPITWFRMDEFRIGFEHSLLLSPNVSISQNGSDDTSPIVDMSLDQIGNFKVRKARKHFQIIGLGICWELPKHEFKQIFGLIPSS